MGPWRALMGTTKGRPGYSHSSARSSSSLLSFTSLSYSGSSLAKAEEHQSYPFAPIARFLIPPHESCTCLSEHIWQGLGLRSPPPAFAQKSCCQNGRTLRTDTEDSLRDSSSKEGLGVQDLGLLEGTLQFFEQKKTWQIARALPAQFAAGALMFKKPLPDALAYLDDTKCLIVSKATNHSQDFSLRMSSCDSVIQAPSCCGLNDCAIHADSVKRKRKKKMNKHKHRKLRRLARKSRK